VGVPIQCRGVGASSEMDSGVTQWTESVDIDAPYAFIIRVFYTKDSRTPLYGSDGSHIGL